jgi:hypothetical protein
MYTHSGPKDRIHILLHLTSFAARKTEYPFYPGERPSHQMLGTSVLKCQKVIGLQEDVCILRNDQTRHSRTVTPG